MKTDNYTLITGASDGLGKFLAFECARRKMNLVLVSLPRSGLPGVATFIAKNFDVVVQYFELDLSEPNACYTLETEIEKRRLVIQVLINNAGLGGTHLFEDRSARFYEQQIRLNVLATTLITRLFIQKLAQCRPAYILNVGSLASFFAMPNKQVYAGTKAFIYSFSLSLRCELRSSGISVSVLCPGGINTNVNMIMLNKRTNWIGKLSIHNPEEVARIAVDGLMCGKAVIVPGILNKVFLMANRMVPGSIREFLIGRTTRRLAPATNVSLKQLQPALVLS
jgi:short-subunit dehydrogenase